jgi:hypothetical protein
MDLVKFLKKNQKLHIHIVMVTLKVASCRIMRKKEKGEKSEKRCKTKILWAKQTFFLAPCPSALWLF